MVMKLSVDEISRYQKDGVVAPITVMSASDANELRGRLESAESSFPQIIGPERRNNAHYVLACLDEIVHREEILDAVECPVSYPHLTLPTILLV